ncbi:class I SAM-dependent DNA methyltransferase [Nonomuraea ferruginea]|uniref:class I SAM-dependent DNA methyltransferase n=1 Tax=Nonomuraea ferruginea TaxID=46174 RepID=UPI00360A69CD
MKAAYDEIADWYAEEFLGAGDPLGIEGVLRGLLGEGAGPCLEIGCGTGVHARVVRELGWAPFGVDLSERMLRHARGRLPTLRADAARLPFADGRLPAVIAVMVHTDMPRYPRCCARRPGCCVPAGCSCTWGCIRASAAGSPTAATRGRW